MVNVNIWEPLPKLLKKKKKKGSWILVNSFLGTRRSGEVSQSRLLLKDCRGLTKDLRGLEKGGNTMPASKNEEKVRNGQLPY